MAATQTPQRQTDLAEVETRRLQMERDTLLAEQAEDEAARGLGEDCNGALPAAVELLEASAMADIEESKWILRSGETWVAHGAPARRDGGYWLTVDRVDPAAGGAYLARMFVPARSVEFVEVLVAAEIVDDGLPF